MTAPPVTTEGLKRHWLLDPDVTYLNHGAFGACPWPVLRVQDEWRTRMERHPVQFHDVELEGHLARAREHLGELVHAQASNLAFVPNATTGVNTVLASLEFAPGDEILATDHEYNACLNAARRVAAKHGATVVAAALPFPTTSPEEMANALLERVTSRTRLVLISHVTSPTGIRLPVEQLVPELAGVASTRSSTAPTHRACCRWTWTPWARRTTPATATSGCAHPRARAFCTCAVIGRR